MDRNVHCELPPVIGHRGAAGRAPENTLAGLRCARALGCAWVEFDARITADGVPVLCHDPTLDRTTDGSGLIAARPFAEVRQQDAGIRFGAQFAGEPVPPLAEALRVCAELGLGANIELKSDRGLEYATAAAVAGIAAGLGGRAPAMLVSSFGLSMLAVLRELLPRVPRGLLFRVVPRGWAALALRLGGAVIGADHRRLRPRRAAEIRAAGYQLSAYTVNDPARARLLYDWGVTSVFSDVPDIILRAGAGRGAASARQGAFW